MLRVLTLCVAAVPLASGLGAQTANGLWRFAHPQAKALIGINWKVVRDSQAGRMMRERLESGIGEAIPGIEFLNDLDEALISSPGATEGRADPQTLIALRGRFDRARVKDLLVRYGAHKQMYGTSVIYRPKGESGRDLAIAQIDERTLLLGDVASVLAGIDRAKSEWTGGDANPVVERAHRLETSYDFWALFTAPGALSLPGAHMPPDAREMEAGISFHNGLSMDVRLDTESIDIARHMAVDLSKVLKLASKDQEAQPGWTEIAKKMRVWADSTAVQVSLRMGGEDLTKATRLWEVARAKRETARAQVQVDVKPVPPQRKTIRIDGLDEGPRDIPIRP
jgi:hypothetical protein